MKHPLTLLAALLLAPLAVLHAAESAAGEASSEQRVSVAGIPTLDDMAGDWMPRRDVANSPAIHNFRDMLRITTDLTSARQQVGLTIGGREYRGIDWRWYPYRVLRRNLDCAGLAVETDTRMINEQRAVLVRVRVTNPGSAPVTTDIALKVRGTLQPDALMDVMNTHVTWAQSGLGFHSPANAD